MARTGGSQVDRQHGELVDLGCGYHELVIFLTCKRLLWFICGEISSPLIPLSGDVDPPGLPIP